MWHIMKPERMMLKLQMTSYCGNKEDNYNGGIMKRIIWINLLIGLVCSIHAQTFQGAISTTDFITGITILQADNITPVPDGWLCQIILPGADCIINAPNPDGSPSGDDLLVSGVPGNNYYEFQFDTSWTSIEGQFYTHSPFVWLFVDDGEEPCANVGDNIYLRIFDAPTSSSAKCYLNSTLFCLPEAQGELYFNTSAHWDYEAQFNWQCMD